MDMPHSARLSAKKLRLHLADRKITHEQLAEDIHCSDRQIRNWVARDTDVHVSHLASLSAALQVPFMELLTDVPALGEQE